MSSGGASSGGATTGGRGGDGTGGTVETGGAGDTGGGAGAGTGGKMSEDGGGNGAGGGAGSASPDAGSGGKGGGTPDSGPGGSDAGDGAVPIGSPVTLDVDLTANAHAISLLIYGVNPSSTLKCSDPNARFTLCRAGSTPWSTYNWENNASNTGSACFENNGDLSSSDTPAQAAVDLVDEAGTRATVVTLPMLDHVAADKMGGSGSPACTGNVENTANYLDTRFVANRSRKGAALTTTPDTTDGFVNQDEFVSALKTHAPTARVLFALDNQTELWNLNQTEVHPNHTTYAELIAKDVEYAKMVRDQWPTAEIDGFVGYGMNAFIDLQAAPDSTGKPEFVSYYLAQMKAAEGAAGQRLIDYLDLHWYSEATGNGVRVINTDASPPDPAVVAARVQAPRSFWDSTYKEDSWIANDFFGGPINLLGWLNQRITTNYSGTKLAFSEWSHGGDEHISGAIAVADTLGIFGREGVAAAAAEPVAADTSFLVGAFAAFRNYDGAGSAFGDTSVSATTSDISRVSVYASTDSTVANRVVLVVINRSGAVAPTTLNLQHANTYTSASVYQVTATSALPQAATALTPTDTNVFTFDAPAYSISVIVPSG
jgi:hypothetical protein